MPGQNQTTNYNAKSEEERLLLFITTHLSDQHVRYFDCCWPLLMDRSKLLQMANILLYTNRPLNTYNTNVTQRIKALFDKSPSITYKSLPGDVNLEDMLYMVENIGFKWDPLQAGANVPMKLAFQLNWFEGYDWVIRINPDVLIRNSTWLMEAMRPVPNNEGINGKKYEIDAILHRCNGRTPHTDFFAFRPAALSYNSSNLPFAELIGGNHEGTAKYAFFSILKSGRYSQVVDAKRGDGVCRIKGPRSSVVHNHDSCRPQGTGDLTCDALEGWDIS